MNLDDFCSKHAELALGTRTLAQYVVDGGVKKLTMPEIASAFHDLKDVAIPELCSASILLGLAGRRHAEKGCYYWDEDGISIGSVCPGCGLLVEDFQDETRYQWKGNLPPRSPDPLPFSLTAGSVRDVFVANTGVNVTNHSDNGTDGVTAKGQLKLSLPSMIIGGVLLAFILGVFCLAPATLPDFKFKILAYSCSILGAIFGALFTGDIVVSLTNTSKLGKLAVQACGGMGLFVLSLWWWSSPSSAVKSLADDAISATDGRTGVARSSDKSPRQSKTSASPKK